MEHVVSEADLRLKEQELHHAIKTFFAYDLTSLKQEITDKLATETEKINTETAQKQSEIQTKFRNIDRLASEHIVRGDKYTVPPDAQQMDSELVTEYEQHSSVFEQAVRNANREK